MNKIIKKVPFIIWGLIPLILIYGLFNKDETLDVNVYDSYFIFALYFILVPLCLYLYLVGLGYYLSYRSDKFMPLSFLTITHVILTITSLLILFFVPQFPEVDPSSMMANIENSLHNQGLRKFGVLGFVIAQIILLINLTISLFSIKTE